eukprot:g16631.t1
MTLEMVPDEEAQPSEPMAVTTLGSIDKFIDSGRTRFVVQALVPLALGNTADAVEILSAGYILSAFKQDDGSPLNSTQKELLTAAVFVGMLVGGLVAGNAADRFGRRSSLLVALGVNCTFAVMSAAAPSMGWLFAARVCAGLGVGGSIPVVFTLGTELFPTRIRGAMVSLIASFWMVGSVFAAAAAWALLGDDFGGNRIVAGATWRHYALVAAIPAASAFLLAFFFVPESPRFLAKAGRYDEMSTVVQRMSNAPVHLPPEWLAEPRPARSNTKTEAANHGFSSRWEFWRYSLGEGRYRSISGRVPDDVNGPESSAVVDPEGEGSRDRCRDRYGHDGQVCRGDVKQVLCAGSDTRLRRSAIILVVVWFTISYGSYGVATWNNQLFADVGLSNPYLCSFIYSLSNLPGNVGSILLVERIGRKPLLSASMALAALAATLFALGSGSGAWVVVSAACLFNSFSTCGWNALGVVSTEAFPTTARVSGMGLVSAAGRLGSIAAQFVNGSLEENVLVLLMVTSGFMFAGGVASLLLPRETLGVSLDDSPPDRVVA